MTTGDDAPPQEATADGDPSEPEPTELAPVEPEPGSGPIEPRAEPEPEPVGLAPAEPEPEPDPEPVEPEPDAVAPDAPVAAPVEDDVPVPATGVRRWAGSAPLAGLDRGRVLFGLGTAVLLVVAGVFGGRLIRALAGDEGAEDTTAVVSGPVGLLVPNVVALTEPPAGPGAPEVAAALASARHDVAVDTTVTALCATVAVTEDVTVAGRWERNGALVSETDPSTLRAPGFTDCIDADGEPLPEGAYQFVVTDGEGAVSAPGTIVLGAPVVAQSFVNETEEPLCGLRLAPLRAGYFELFDATAEPIAPGATVTVPLAGVRQTFEAVACGDADTVASALIRPDAAAARAITAG